MQTKSTTTKHRNGKHWKYIAARRENRRRVFQVSTKQIALSQVVVLVGSVSAGALLESNKAAFIYAVGALLVLPGIVDLTSSVGAALSAKINHRLEESGSKKLSVFLSSYFNSMVTVAGAGLIVAGVGAGVGRAFFEANFWQLFFLAELSAVIAAIIGFPIIGALSLWLRKLKVSPDDVVGPVESAIMYIVVIIVMTGVIGWGL